MTGQPPSRALLDALTEAALERDESAMADWWAGLDTAARDAAAEAWRRGYAAAWHDGAGASDRTVDR